MINGILPMMRALEWFQRSGLRWIPGLGGLAVALTIVGTATWATPATADEPSPRGGASPHWAFQPIARPAVPTEGSAQEHPIDAFIRASLRSQGLIPNPPASPRDLVRRLYWDLVGLPPEPQEVAAFEMDPSRTRYGALVERLLASPRHGERWARHWLDVVRYTESQGFEYDRPRDNAWHYRDYVIRSLNADLPYDRFMREQVAGDVLEPVTSSGIIASSLLVSGPWDQAGNSQANATQRAITREEEMDDLVSVVGQTFLGLTVNCARCHDHKFDPIPLADYYRVKAVFDGVRHGDRSIEGAEETRQREIRRERCRREIETESRRVAELEALARLTPAEIRERDAARLRLQEAQRRLQAEDKPAGQAYAGRREQPTPTRVLRRGDVKSPGDTVSPAGLSSVGPLVGDLGLAPDAPEAERRRRFADWLADPRNPLPARVLVNRVWGFHFGAGLVATPSDLGRSGAKPSHPELLDWLAREFVARGWSIKALHRLIVSSETYRQSSEARADALAKDADAVFLWRFPPRRLEGEAIRDAMLAVSGQLNLQSGGPSFRPFTTSEYGATFYHLVDRGTPEFNRRTVYRMNINSGKEPLLDALDCPDPSVRTPRRGVTTTPLQALGLMNSSFVQRQADQLARRARALTAREEPDAMIETVWRLALGRRPNVDEARLARETLRERGLPHVAWVLLNTTEFVYVR